jgi:hypothetical protein
MRRLWPLVFVLLIISSGCAPTTIGSGDEAGVGVFSYITRDVKATYHVNIDKAWPATLKAVAQLNLTVASEHIDPLSGALAVQRADGTEVNIHLTRLNPSTTRISVRVGPIGNKIKSVLIHDAIRNALHT